MGGAHAGGSLTTLGFGLGSLVEGSMTDLRGDARGRRRPSGGCRLWAARPGGDGAADGVVEDIQWAVSAAGANDGSV